MNEKTTQLLDAIQHAVLGQRLSVAHTLGRLIAVDDQKLWRQEGCSSLSELCTRRFDLGEIEAQQRAAVVRVAKRHLAVRDIFVNDRLRLEDFKKPLREMTPAKAIARALVEVCMEGEEVTDEMLAEIGAD